MTDEAAVETRPRGFFQNLLDIYVAPRQAFTFLLAKPNVWLPLLLWLGLSLGFSLFWVAKTDPRMVVKAQIEEAGFWDKIPADRREQVLDSASEAVPRRTIMIFAAIPPITFLVVSGTALLVFAFVVGAEVRFRQVGTVVAWSYLAVTLILLPLTLVLLSMKEDWNYPLQLVLRANLSMFLDRTTTSRILYLIADSIDLFSFWTIYLLAAGLGVATRRTTGQALGPVVGLWVVWIIFKIGLSFILPGILGR